MKVLFPTLRIPDVWIAEGEIHDKVGKSVNLLLEFESRLSEPKLEITLIREGKPDQWTLYLFAREGQGTRKVSLETSRFILGVVTRMRTELRKLYKDSRRKVASASREGEAQG